MSLKLRIDLPEIQKDILCAAAHEIVNVTVRDVGDALCAILIDESRDNSIKEQMVVAIRNIWTKRVRC